MKIIEEESIDLQRYLAIFLGRWWLFLLLPIVGVSGAHFYNQGQELAYQSEATILVQQRGSAFAIGVNDFTASSRLASTYRRQVTAKPFLEQVAQKEEVPYSLGQLRSIVSASTANDPPAVVIRARHADPVVTATVAQLVADEFIGYAIDQRLGEIARVQAAAVAQGLTVEGLVASQLSAIDTLSLLEPVESLGSPVSASARKNLILGGILGILLAVGGAFFAESLRDQIGSIEQLSSRFGLNGLGAIFKWSPREADEGDVVIWKAPSSGYAEAFRQIRLNLEFAMAGHPGNSLLVSSPGPGEGKSTILANLAVALAQSGKRVVVVDADLRRPSLHRLFLPERRQPGLSNILAGQEARIHDAIYPTHVDGVDIVPSGPTPPNPTELLGSPMMAGVVDQLKEEYGYVLVDSPPILAVADTSALATLVDGLILVLDGTGTKMSSLKAAMDTIRNTPVDILGAIVNKLKVPRFGYGYGYSYYHYYQSYHRYQYGTDPVGVDGVGRSPRGLRSRAGAVLSRLRRR